MFSGCGHTVLSNVCTCLVCKATLQSKVRTLGKKADDAVFNDSFDDDKEVNDDDDSGEADDDQETNDADHNEGVDENESEE